MKTSIQSYKIIFSYKKLLPSGLVSKILSLGFLFTSIACEDFVEIEPPRNEVTAETIFDSDEGAIAAISGIYAKMGNSFNFTGGGIETYTGLSGDEFLNSSSDPERAEFFSNSLNAENSLVQRSIWTESFNHIFNANAIIEGIPNAPDVTPEVKNQVWGEALFIRAFCYFYLVNIYGDIPFLTTTDFELNSKASKTDVSQVYQFIEEDLLKAQSLLADDYGFVNDQRLRPNKGTATALLARVYLYKQDWALAETEATSLIDNAALYSLEPDLNNVFLPNSKGIIWAIKPNTFDDINIVKTRKGTDYLPLFPGFTLGGVKLRPEFDHIFEEGDGRHSNWILNDGSGNFYPYKYKLGPFYNGSNKEEWDIVFRLGEQYLIRAEARAHLGDITGAQADINAIRYRAGLGDTPAAMQVELLLAIEQERRVELFVEWGHRWLDLKRTRRADAVFSIIPEKDWQSTDVLWPIPAVEIQNNPNLLPQNEGY